MLPPCDVPKTKLKSSQRELPLRLPELSETEISRHYTALAKQVHGVNDGFYPLGSCTMKYNPKINEKTASLEGFSRIHPLQPKDTVKGCTELLRDAEKLLSEITGMDAVSFQPAAGAHGEFTGLLLIKAYHEARKDTKRTKIIVPDSAHGTNPASAVMAGMTVVNIPSTPDGCVDLEKLREAVGEDTAGLMLTNPNTVGLFDKNITKITEIVHKAGGLCYYDGANLNAVMGVVRPGDMGFDVVHLNLHKTFSTPHGGGGPGSGPVGCKKILKPFLPNDGIHSSKKSIGCVKNFWGNFAVVVKAYTYMLSLGASGLREASLTAVLNANYMLKRLYGAFEVPFGDRCMHEFVICAENLKKEYGITATDIAKSLIDKGIHPPTVYFPLIVHEAMMFEPTETESKESIDGAADAMLEILERAKTAPETLHAAPVNAPISRPDEVTAARNPILKYEFPEEN